MRRAVLFIFVLCLLIPSVSMAQTTTDKVKGENQLISAVMQYERGRLDDAEGILKELISADPSNDAAYYYMALTLLAKGDVSGAEENLKTAARLDPGNYWYRYRLAALYSATSRKELTVDMYEKLLEDFPKKSELYFNLVDLYAAQGENEKALETLKEIETVFGVTESTAVFRFQLLQKMGRQDEAFASLEEYNRQYSSPYVLSTLADWQMSMYNDSTALAYYDEALDIAPDFAPALLGKAEALRITRKYDEYFSVLDRFVRSADSPAPGKSDYLMAITQRTDPKFLRSFRPQIDSAFNAMVQKHPTDSSVLNTAAVYYYSTGRKDQAADHFLANVQAWPESISASAAYVEFLMYAQDWKTLAEQGRKAFERFPQETDFLEMASVGNFNLEEYDQVLEICDRILKLAPADSARTLRAWSTAGDIYYRKGDAKKAFKAYENALKVNPEYVYVLNNYAYYLSQQGKKLKKAYSMSRKTVEAEPDNATYLDTYGWILYLMGKPAEAKPVFKHAMLYGGKDSAVVMDHYSEVLFALGEFDLAFVYWEMALKKNEGDEVPGLSEKIRMKKKEAGR